MGCGSTKTKSNFTLTHNTSILPDKIIEDISSQHFKKIKLIGEGSFGKVYLIKSKETGKEYALKEINIEEKKVDWKREIDILKTIDHPNIISFKCAFKSKQNENICGIITEYADNGDLSKLIKEKKKKNEYFKEELLLNWLIQLCLAIQTLHEEEIIHRNIKPSNIYLMKDNSIKLGDFGIAKDISSFHHTKSIKGTPHYMAPEIIEKIKNENKNKNKKYDYKVDIWSLGVTFCHLMTLEYPFDSETESGLYKNILKGIKNKKILNEEGKNYNDIILKNYSKDFLDIIGEMMALNSKKRPDIGDIFKKSIVIERMDSLLKDNKFNEVTAGNEIKKYQEKEQKILKLTQGRNDEKIEQLVEKKDDLVIVSIEEGDIVQSEDIKNEEETLQQNQKLQLHYNYLRQLSLIYKERLKRNNTIPSNFVNN